MRCRGFYMLKKAAAFALSIVVSNEICAQAWIRIDQPSAIQRANLSEGVRDYGGFIWMQDTGRAVSGANVQRIEQPFEYSIDGVAYDPLVNRSSALQNPWHQASTGAAPDFRLVQLFGPPRAQDLAALRAAGLRPVRYLAPFSYIVWADRNALEAAALNRASVIRWAGDFLPSQRVPEQSRLSTRLQPSMALIDKASADSVLVKLRELGASKIETSDFTPDLALLQFDLPGQMYAAAARVPGVFTLQNIADGAGPRGEMSNQSVVGGFDASFLISPGYQSWLTPTNVDGAGVKVAIVDGGMRTSHIDLASAIAPCSGTEGACTTSNNSHGTHVAGAVAGRGTSAARDAAGFLLGQGVAPGASLIQLRYGPFLGNGAGSAGSMVANGMLKIFKDASVSGAQLANNSWGPSSTPQGYDIPTMQVDMIARDANPDIPGPQPMLTVWSIMNGNGDSAGACAPSSLGSPDEAKNILSVGSTQLQNIAGEQVAAIFNVSDNSAHGPACDGRIVPNIVAPGCHTSSTSSGSDSAFAQACGTSMASPIVSGASALFWQWYRNTYAVEPSPAIVKAVLTATAVNLKDRLDADGHAIGQRPNRFSGWGRLDLNAVLKPAAPMLLYDQAQVFTSSGASWQQAVVPVDPNLPVRIMLAWTDAPGPGTGGSTPAWTNDLDLSATLAAASFRGNNLDAITGFSTSGGSTDSRNNLEALFFSPSQHLGQPFNVRVLAASLAADALNPWQPQGPRQDFALACLNCRVSNGTYRINAPTQEIPVCRGETSAPIDLLISTNDGATLPVTLASSLGAVFDSASFVPNPIQPLALGSSSQLRVAVRARAALGSTSLRVTGTAGASEVVESVPFKIITVPDDLSLSVPIDGALDVPLIAGLSWTSVSDAQRYRIELSRDADFGSLNVSAEVLSNSFTPRALRPNTRYFWRVRAQNLCGESAFSTGSFTTVAEDALFSDGFYE